MVASNFEGLVGFRLYCNTWHVCAIPTYRVYRDVMMTWPSVTSVATECFHLTCMDTPDAAIIEPTHSWLMVHALSLKCYNLEKMQRSFNPLPTIRNSQKKQKPTIVIPLEDECGNYSGEHVHDHIIWCTIRGS